MDRADLRRLVASVLEAEEAAHGGDWALAAGHYRGARRLAPGIPQIPLREGVCLLRAGDPGRAREAFAAAAEDDPSGEADAWAAVAAARAGDEALAVDHALRALAGAPGRVALDLLLGDPALAGVRRGGPVAAALRPWVEGLSGEGGEGGGGPSPPPPPVGGRGRRPGGPGR